MRLVWKPQRLENSVLSSFRSSRSARGGQVELTGLLTGQLEPLLQGRNNGHCVGEEHTQEQA